MKFKDLSNLLLEYLTDEQRARYVDVAAHPTTIKNRKHTDHYFGNSDIKKIDIPEPEDTRRHVSDTHKKVEEHLGKTFTAAEYKSGSYPHPDKPGQHLKIGKRIKDAALQNAFSQDKERAGSKLQGHYMSAVRGIEVAGQTNSARTDLHPEGHSWHGDSCKNVDTGGYKSALKGEIKHGTVVAFGHDKSGQEIYRATLQPHVDKKGNRIYAVNSQYGVKHPHFVAHANKIAADLSTAPDTSKQYKIHHGVYDNEGEGSQLHPRISAEDISKILQKHVPNPKTAEYEHIRRQKKVIKLPHLNAEHLHLALKNGDADLKTMALRHPNIDNTHLEAAMKVKNSSVRGAALAHPLIPQEHLEKAMKIGTDTEKGHALRNPNIAEKHLTKAIAGHKTNHTLTRHALQNPNVTEAHLTKALSSTNAVVRADVINHKNANSAHLMKGLKDKSSAVAYTAIQHPNIRKEHLDVALKHPNLDIRSRAAGHRRATPEHLVTAMKDSKPWIAIEAIRNPANTAETISHAIRSGAINRIHNYDDWEAEQATNKMINNRNFNSDHITQLMKRPKMKTSVIKAALKSPKATTDHITQSLTHKESTIRSVAVAHPSISDEHLHKALKDSSTTVVKAAMKNPRIGDAHLTGLQDHKEAGIRSAVLKHPLVSHAHLLKGLTDKDLKVRMQAAMHANTPLALKGVMDKSKSELKEYFDMHNFNANTRRILSSVLSESIDSLVDAAVTEISEALPNPFRKKRNVDLDVKPTIATDDVPDSTGQKMCVGEAKEGTPDLSDVCVGCQGAGHTKLPYRNTDGTNFVKGPVCKTCGGTGKSTESVKEDVDQVDESRANPTYGPGFQDGEIKLGGKYHPANKIPIEHHAEFKKKFPGSETHFLGPRKKDKHGSSRTHTLKADATHFKAWTSGSEPSYKMDESRANPTYLDESLAKAGRALFKAASAYPADHIDKDDHLYHAKLLMSKNPADHVRSARHINHLDTASRDEILDHVWNHASEDVRANYFKVGGYTRLHPDKPQKAISRKDLLRKEDVEQIDEISKKTMLSYRDKAKRGIPALQRQSSDHRSRARAAEDDVKYHRRHSMDHSLANPEIRFVDDDPISPQERDETRRQHRNAAVDSLKSQKRNEKESGRFLKKVDKRREGIRRAENRLTEEENGERGELSLKGGSQLDDYALHVKPHKKGGYEVHAHGYYWSHKNPENKNTDWGLQIGDRLDKDDLGDFKDMGAKIKHVTKEELTRLTKEDQEFIDMINATPADQLDELIDEAKVETHDTRTTCKSCNYSYSHNLNNHYPTRCPNCKSTNLVRKRISTKE